MVTVADAEGERQMPVKDLFRIPGAEGERENTLKPNEIVTEILVPSVSGWKTATYEVRQRRLLDWPLATASVACRMSGNNVRDARVVMGHVAPIPWRSSEAETALKSKGLSDGNGGSGGQGGRCRSHASQREQSQSAVGRCRRQARGHARRRQKRRLDETPTGRGLRSPRPVRIRGAGASAGRFIRKTTPRGHKNVP